MSGKNLERIKRAFILSTVNRESLVGRQARKAMILLAVLGVQSSQRLNIAKYAFSFLKWPPQSQMTIDLALNLRNCSGLWRLPCYIGQFMGCRVAKLPHKLNTNPDIKQICCLQQNWSCTSLGLFWAFETLEVNVYSVYHKSKQVERIYCLG